MTFRKKIILVLVISATFPVSIVGLLSVRGYQKEMTNRIDSFNKRSAELAASGIADFLIDAHRSVTLSSSVIPFEQFPSEDLPDALKIPYRQFDYLNIVGLFDENGDALSHPAFETHPEQLKGLEGHEPVKSDDLRRFAAQIPFSEALANGWAYGAPYLSTRGGNARVALAVTFPVRKETAHWVLAVEISLRSLKEKMGAIRPHSPGGIAFIFDKLGYAVVHSDDALMQQPVSLGGLSIVTNGIERKTTMTDQYQALNGADMAGAYAPIPITDWGLVVAQPVEEAFAAVDRMRRLTLLWISLGLLSAILGGIVLARRLIAPIRELARGAVAIGAGDFKWRMNLTTDDEIGRLAKTFNDMSATLEQSFDTISEKNEEIAKWNEELQQRVTDRTRELRQAEDQIIRSQKTAVVTELSAGIAHQINNPLTSIMGFSQFMLSQTDENHKFNRYLTAIVKGAKRIETLVDDMLRFSRNTDHPRFTHVDLNQLLENTLAMLERQLQEHRINTSTSLASELPLASGDPTELQQAIIHLVHNAQTAMPDGGDLTVETEGVEGGAIKLSIEDTGVGISEEQIPNIFDLFYTTNDKWSKKGVGLSVADRIIRDHKGKISVTSKVGHGSTFTIFLPGVQKTTHLG